MAESQDLKAGPVTRCHGPKLVCSIAGYSNWAKGTKFKLLLGDSHATLTYDKTLSVNDSLGAHFQDSMALRSVDHGNVVIINTSGSFQYHVLIGFFYYRTQTLALDLGILK